MRRAFHCAVFAVSLLLIGAAPTSTTAPSGVEITTEHYDLYCEGPNPQEYGRLLEQLYAQLKSYFGAEPDRRLRVKMLADMASYVATLKADGIDYAEKIDFTNGVYYSGLKIAFVKQHVSLWQTSADLIHECTHQFQCLACGKDQQWPSSKYYTEGLAKYFDHRHWDGTTLQAATVEWPPGENVQDVLDRFHSVRHGDLRNILIDPGYHHPTDPEGMSYDEAYLFVRFLIERIPTEFRALTSRLDRQSDPGATWDETIGKSGLNLNVQFETWLSGHLKPTSFETLGLWIVAGDWIEGSVLDDKIDERGYRSFASMVLKEHVDRIKVHVRNAGSNAEAGVWIAVLPNGPTWYVLIGQDGHVGVIHYEPPGKWSVEWPVRLEKRPETFQLTVRRATDHWIVQLENETEIAIPAPADARVGAAVAGRAEFNLDSGDARK